MKRYALLIALLGCTGERESTPRSLDSASGQASAPAGPSRAPAAQPAPAATESRRRIVFAGTSLTAGYGLDPDSAYPFQVQRMIDSAGLRFEVVNAGVSGETSSGLLQRLEWLLRGPFDILVIETGANDGLRGIPVETMERNIQQIIEGVRATKPGARVALVQMEAPPNLGRDYTRQFREVFPELARKNGVLLLPFLLEGVAGTRELNQPDGIHPNYDGERILARNVWKGLRPLLQ